MHIHPDAYERMRVDPNFAVRVTSKIDRHFKRQAAAEEARHKGSSVGMSQFVAITADGEIGDYIVATLPREGEVGYGSGEARKIRIICRKGGSAEAASSPPPTKHGTAEPVQPRRHITGPYPASVLAAQKSARPTPLTAPSFLSRPVVKENKPT